MRLNLEPILSLLFPPSSDERTIVSCTKESFRRKLSPHDVNGVRALTWFSDPHIRSAIHLVKFHNHPHARVLLGSLLREWLHTLPCEPYLVLPVPLSAQRLSKRGHNQVETIIREALADMPHIVLRTNIIKRVRHTQSQTSLLRHERKQNLKEAFVINQQTVHKLAGKKVILLDDVITTGATLQEAKKALACANASSIITVALAH